MNELLKIVELQEYSSAIKMLTYKNRIIINYKINDAHFTKYDDYKEKAKISLDDLTPILKSKEEVNFFINYVSKKLIKYDGCDEQEYPEGEEPAEYCILKNNRDYIDKYVKLIRIPNAKNMQKN
jgi:hypothetical protein